MDLTSLTLDEKQRLKTFLTQLEQGEMAQVKDLIDNCNISFQFAKTHSIYVKDWEKTKNRMESVLDSEILPPNVSANLLRASIQGSEEVMNRKLLAVQEAFLIKFGEPIFNYLGKDGKTKDSFGMISLTKNIKYEELKKTFVGRLIQISLLILKSIWFLLSIFLWITVFTNLFSGRSVSSSLFFFTIAVSVIPLVFIYISERIWIYLIFGERMFGKE